MIILLLRLSRIPICLYLHKIRDRILQQIRVLYILLYLQRAKLGDLEN